MIDEKHPVEVVELVLEQTGHQLIGLDADLVAVEVEAHDVHCLRAGDLPRQTRHRQTALLVHPFAVAFLEHRVDEHLGAVAVVVDEEALPDPDLGSGQAESIGVVHRVEHVVGQTRQSTVELGDDVGRCTQHRVAEDADCVGRHGLKASVGAMATDAPDTPPTGSHYFAREPDVASARATVPLVLPDLTTELVTDRGVFAHDRLDVGTRLLLIDGPPLRPASTRLVDLGCGYGPIAVALAHRAPTAQVWAVDVNRRAVELARENLRPYPNATALLADELPSDLVVDEVWSNPPIRIGKRALHELLVSWHARLEPGGRMVLVVQKHLGADSLHRWCESQGWPSRRHRARATFRILEIDAVPEATP